MDIVTKKRNTAVSPTKRGGAYSMKKPFRLVALLLAVCLAAPWVFPVGVAAEEGTTHTLADLGSLPDLLAQDKVKDGDTIRLTGGGAVQTTNEAPWIINKSVTITGGEVYLRAHGILLNADVTFKDTSITFTSNVRNSIMANGHTLTLENVACGGHSFNLFCGGLLKSDYETFDVPAPGQVGRIYIKGSTTLQYENTFGSGNIYAGNLCMGGMTESNNGPDKNGPENVFRGNAVINVEGSGDVGTVYACGGQQRIPVGAPNGKVTLPDAARYTVSGSVTVNGNVPDVEGAGAAQTHVNYRDDSNYAISRTFSNLSSLSVEKGNLELEAGSHSLNGVDVFLTSGAKLNLKALAGRVPTLGDFTGNGGILILDKSQTLPISGAVTGTTKVAIGHTNFDDTQSTALPIQGWCYIQAPQSNDGAFTLLPYATQPTMMLVRSGNGNWTIPVAGESNAKLESLAPENMTVASGATEVDVPLDTTYSGAGLGLNVIPLILRVNGIEAVYNEGLDCYEAAGLRLFAGLFDNEWEEMGLTPDSVEENAPIPDNIYRIEIVVPGAYTVSGENLAASFTLTVGDVTAIPVPQANPGLVWTGAEQVGVNEGTGYTLTGHKATDAGDYTATATPESGYRWEDGTAGNKSISWSIAKAAAPAAPTGLAGVAPTSTDGTDGKLTGTTAEMEYSTGVAFSDPQDCGERETTGLAAGTYYVRVKGSSNRLAGEAAEVTVPAYEAPTPEHRHTWSGNWSTSTTHHWHNCTGENCPIQADSEKDGYAAHTAGEWIIDQAATATQSGSKHKVCTVCGYEMARETIPATGGSTGGGSTGGGGSAGGGSSSGGGGMSGADTDTGTTTVKNPDGSTTTTTTDKATGTVTATTKYKDGTTTSVSTDKDGKTQAQVKLSDTAVKAAQKENEAVSLPIPAVNAAAGDNAPVVEIDLPGGGDAVKVEIPVKNAAPGVVAVVVGADGTEMAVKKSAVTKDGVTLALNGDATVKLADNSAAFSDVPASNWAKNAVDFVSARGIFNGTGGNAFSPDNTMTRGMLAVVLHNLEDSPAHAFDGAFDDVEESWYTDAVHWAAEQGIVTGYGDGRYGPNDDITREQLAVILWRYAGSPAAKDGDLPFADADKVSGYAVEALRWAKEQGIVNGDGNGQLMPQGLTTRAQAAQMLMNFIQTQF